MADGITDCEKFVHERGWEFKTDDAIKAAFERLCKCKQDVLITQDEFIAEAAPRGGEHREEMTISVYDALADLVNSGKLKAGEVYQYARFKWCFNNRKAIIAYQTEQDRWEVNNCGTEVSEDRAKVVVNREWGFEVSRIRIIGTPYYDATDYQYIRFDCGYMTWLWKNGSLYHVYA